jgi:hypothetical protein
MVFSVFSKKSFATIFFQRLKKITEKNHEGFDTIEFFEIPASACCFQSFTCVYIPATLLVFVMKRKASKARAADATAHVKLPEGDHHLAMQKLIYDYLLTQNLGQTAKSLTKEVTSDSKYFKSLHCPDTLPLVYRTYMNVKELSRSIDFTDHTPQHLPPPADQQPLFLHRSAHCRHTYIIYTATASCHVTHPLSHSCTRYPVNAAALLSCHFRPTPHRSLPAAAPTAAAMISPPSFRPRSLPLPSPLLFLLLLPPSFLRPNS